MTTEPTARSAGETKTTGPDEDDTAMAGEVEGEIGVDPTDSPDQHREPSVPGRSPLARQWLQVLAVVLVLAVASVGLFAVIHRGPSYAAVVNGSVISQAELSRDLGYTAKNKQYVTNVIDAPGGLGPFQGSKGPGSYGATYAASLLSSLIQRELLHQVLVGHHALPSAADFKAAKSEVSQQQYFTGFPVAYQNVMIMQQAEVVAFVRVESAMLTPDQINQYYVANEGNYSTEACVSDIVIADKLSGGQFDSQASRTHAAQIKAMLDGGADFAALAMKDSADTGPTGSAATGGKLKGSATDGCLSRSDLRTIAQDSPEFVKAVVSLALNTVSEPVMTVLGYHLIKVSSRVIAPLSSVKSDIEQNLAGQALTKLEQQAKVKVDPQLGTYSSALSSTGAVTGVVPPSSDRHPTTTSKSGQ